MTREQVLAMTDEQLRIKAAELMGWERSTGKMAELLPWKDPQGVSRLDLPDYPHNMNAAWELAIGAGLSVVFYDDIYEAGRLDGGPNIGGEYYFDIRRRTATDDTAPRAITRAFILAMEGDDES